MAADGEGQGVGRRLATFATLLLLGALLLQWTSSQLGSEMASLGERVWPGYGVGLREEPTPPLRPEPPSAEPAAPSSGQGEAEGSGVDVDEILGELAEGGAEAPSGEEGAVDLDGILGQVEAEPAGGEEGEVDLDGILGQVEAGEEAESAGGDRGEVDLDGILGQVVDGEEEGAGTKDEKAPRFASAEELRARKYEDALAAYDGEVEAYERAIERRTPVVKAYAAVDLALLSLFTWLSEHFAPLFILFLGLGGLVATGGRHHISLRPIRSRLDDRVAQGGSLVANLLLIASVLAQYRGRLAAGSEVEAGEGLQAGLWIGAFAGMALLNLLNLARPKPAAAGSEGSEESAGGVGHALMTLPLYAVMALIGGLYLLVAEGGYVAGLAVYLEKLLANVQLYLQVGLYIWVGMLLKRTRLASLAFAVVRPWRLPPELLAIVVVLLAAIPTAYSGASGIFVIAAGALIFRELTAAGARPSLALASTAMSGSMGVVLSPCLLVVIISYLSPSVSSDELFGWGRWVFLLSAALFAGIVVLTRQGSMRPNPSPDAWRQSGLALRGLLPHVVIFAAVLLVARVLLGASLDVNSAAFILPLALLPMLAYDRRVRLREARAGAPSEDGLAPSEATAFAATAETSVHVGALLLLMALSAGVGGVIERAEVVALVPAAFASPTLAIAILMVVLVLIGMVMDPYGAVILVQATLSTVAVESGISLLHFWMVVLVAFELGYLTPPVALNHLLARQVIGDAMPKPGSGPGREASLWRRHERYLLPITVMTLTLVLVAFGPIILGE